MGINIKERARAMIKLLKQLLPVALMSTVLSMGLVRCVGEFATSKILGSDNSDVRSVYYHSIAQLDITKDSFDQLVIYNPITNLPNRDKLTQLADELRNVSKYRPSLIVFDYILADTASYSLTGSHQIVEAIQACLDSGIVFIAAEEKYTDPHSNKTINNSSFFVKTPYVLNVERGNTATMFNKALNRIYSDDILWMPLVVASHVKGTESHPSSFYDHRYISFEPGQIETAFNGHPADYLRKRITSKIVIFSSHTASDDVHELPFPVKTIPDGDIDYNYQISGAELLWYSVRDEIYGKWDKKASVFLVFFVTLLLTYMYIYCIFKWKCSYANKDSLCHRFIESIVSFLIFLAAIAILLILCLLMMSWHIVFPVAVTTTSLVIVNLFEPLWGDLKIK